MDIKKKAGEYFEILDNLARKIPENISSILTKIVIGIFVATASYGIYYSVKLGLSSAKEEGTELARDTKSMFLEDIEREYSRKRKNIRMHDSSRLIGDDQFQPTKQFEHMEREKKLDTLSEPNTDVVEKKDSLIESKESGETAPLAEIQYGDTGFVPLDKEFETLTKSDKKYKRNESAPSKDEFPSSKLDTDNDEYFSEKKQDHYILNKKKELIKSSGSIDYKTEEKPSKTEKSSDRFSPRTKKERKKGRDLLPLD